MKKPHKHAEIIKAWADGDQVQFKNGDQWIDLKPITKAPSFDDDSTKWRIKPAISVVYTRMTDQELAVMYLNFPSDGVSSKTRKLVNAGISRAMADGQIVSTEDRANRDMAIIKVMTSMYEQSAMVGQGFSGGGGTSSGSSGGGITGGSSQGGGASASRSKINFRFSDADVLAKVDFYSKNKRD